MRREIRQLPLPFPPPPEDPALAPAIAALQSLRAIADEHTASTAQQPQEAASGGECAEIQRPAPLKPLVGAPEWAKATVDRIYQHCPEDPQVWVTFPDACTERLPVVAGWSDQRYVAAAFAARATALAD